MANEIDWSQFKPDTLAPSGDLSGFIPDPTPAKPGLLRRAADLGLDFTQGAYGAIGAGASAFGADNLVALGAGEISRYATELQSEQRQAERRTQADRMKAAEETGSAWEEVKAAGQNVAETPFSFFASALGSLVPTAAASVVGGAPAALTLGAGIGAGAVKQSIAERTEEEALAAGQTPEQAAAAAREAQAYRGDNLDQITLGAGLGALAGGTGAERLLGGGASAIKNVLGRAAAGAVTEAVPEGIQGGQERLAANIAAQRGGFGGDTWTGVAGQGTTEALASTGPGGVVGAMTPYIDPNAGPISRAAIKAQEQQAIGALPAPGQLSGDATMQMSDSVLGQDPTGALDLQRRNTELQEARASQEAQRDGTYRAQVNGTQPTAGGQQQTTTQAEGTALLPFTQPPYAGPAPTVGEQGGRWADPRIAIAGEPLPDPAAQLETNRPTTGDQYLEARRKRAQGELLSQQEAALLNGPDPFEGQTVSLATATDPVTVAARKEAVQDVAFANGDEPANVRVFSSQDLPDGPSGNQRGAGLTRSAATVIEGLGRIFGTQYRFYDSPNAATRGDGFVLRGRRPGVAYVRAVEGDAAPLVVAGHETYHTFTPAERARFSAAIEPFVDASDTALLSFLSDYTGGRYQAKALQLVQAGVSPTEVIESVIAQAQQDGVANLDRAKLREEFDADIFGNRMKDTGFWEKVFTELKAQDRTLLVKIRDSIKQVINYLKSQAGKVRGFNTDQYIRDLDAVQRIAARTLLSAANTQQKSERGSRGAVDVVRSGSRDRIGPYPTEAMANMNKDWLAKKEGVQYALEQAADGFYLTRTGATNEGQGQADRGRAAGAVPDAERRGSRDVAPDVRQRAAGGSESAARQSRAPLAVESRVRTDAGGRVSLTGIHFSRQPRTALSGSYYGTGLKGAEGRRLQGASDRRLLSRVYAYVNEGKGVKPESGVGSYPHTVELSNLYDFAADPLKLIRKHQGDLNAVESAILDEGFDGYYVRDAFGNQGAAVVLGDASIGVEATPVEAEVMRSPKRTLEKENQVSVTVGGKPGEFGWSPAAKLAAENALQDYMPEALISVNKKTKGRPVVDPTKLVGIAVPPFVGPTQQRPNLEAVGEAVRKVLSAKPARDTIEALTGAKITGVSQIAGSWEGKPEPSFVLSGEMSFEQANEVSKVLGFLMAQDATVAAQPWFEETKDQIPAILISQNKVMTAEQVKALSDAAREAGLDYSTTVDGRGAKFLHFGDQDGFRALSRQVTDIAKAAGLKEVTPFHVRSNLNDSKTYLEGGLGSALRGTGDEAGSTGPSDLFRRAVDSILVPYAKAVGAEGYRFSPERHGQRFGLTDVEVEYIRAALRPKSGKALSTVPIVAGAEKLEPPRNNNRTKIPGVSKNDLLWALQNRVAQAGFIEPGDYSPEARKIISDAIADEVIYNLGKESGKNAVGWYDAALKKAKETYEQVFPELRQDKDREMLFDAILGIASQGNDVHSNAVFAGRMYYLITREGMTLGQATQTLSGTFGEKTSHIEGNYLKLEHLLDTNGYDRMREFFNTKATVGEFNAILRKDKTLFGPNGKKLEVEGAAEQIVSGWMVFGPKIGSFINNLHGDYSTLTADLWFSRTWNRMLGYVFNHKADTENNQYITLYRAMLEEARTGEGRDAVGLSQFEVEQWAADPESMLTFAREVHRKRELEYKTLKNDAVTPLRQAAKNLLEARTEATEIPRGPLERYFQQTTVEQAQKAIRRKTGVNISIADIQAVLWYHEKDLYKSFGVGDSKAEAADYADAAARFVDRFNEGELFFVEKPKPRYVMGEKGSYLRDEGDVSRSARRNELGFYSQLSRAVDASKFQTQPAGQWKLWLASNAAKAGVKADEVQWSGINEWLELQGKRKVEKAEVLQYLEQGGVQIQEVQKGANGPAAKAKALRELGWPTDQVAQLSDRELEAAYLVSPEDMQDFLDRREAYEDGMTLRDAIERADAYGFRPEQPQPDTRYGNNNLVLPGGENYREVLLTLPEPDRAAAAKKAGYTVRKAPWGWQIVNPAGDGIGMGTGATADEALADWAQVAVAHTGGRAFKSGHWDEQNVLAHMRLNDRTTTDGRRVLFVEEIQSDWGQAGRDAGFGDVANWTDAQIRAAVEENDPNADTEGLDRATLLEMARNSGVTLASSVPAAPFVQDTKSWVSLALKRVISMAAEGGYDAVAVVNGQQSADRYSLRKQIESIGYDPKTQTLTGYNTRRAEVLNQAGVAPAQVADYVGKEVAQRLLATELSMGKHLLSGEEIEVGGDGMKAFYDRIVPQVANDVLKKLGGGRVAPVSIDGVGEQLGFDITPAMRETVTGDGLPMFSAARTRFEPEMHRDFLRDLGRAVGKLNSPKGSTAYNAGFHQPIQVMRTPPVLRAVYERAKANSRPFRQSESVVGTGATIYLKSQDKFPGSDHGRPVDGVAVQRLPQLIADPIAVFQSTETGEDPNSFKVLGADSRGFFVAAIKPGYMMEGAQKKTNFSATIFPVQLGQVTDWVKKGALRYWDDRLQKAEAQGMTGAIPGFLGPLSRSEGAGWLPGGPKSIGEIFSLAKAPVKIITRSELEGTPEAMLSAPRANFGDMTQAQEDALRAVGLLREPKTIRERFAELTDNLAKRLTQGVVDQYAPLKELDFRSYVLARMSKGTDGTFEAMLYYGRPQINGDTVEIDTAPGGLMEVLSTLSGEQDRFLAWIAANRAEQLTAEGREFLFTSEQIRELKGLNQGQMADGRGRAIEYARVLREFNAFQDSVLAIAEARGLIDAESRQVWRDGFYVPFYRNMEDGTTGPSVKSGLVNQYAFKKLKGSSRQLNEDLLANTLQNMAHLLSAAGKNQAAAASLRAAESAGVAHRVPSGTKGAVRFLDAGREQHYLIDDPFIYDAITSLESVNVVGLEKVLSKFKHWLTMGVTINPAFQLRSLMRDAIQSVAITKIDTNPLANVKQGIASQLAKDQDYINALASGGLIRFNSLLEGNRADHTRKLIKMGVADSTILDTREKVEMFFTKALDKWLAVGDISESTNRMALYKQLIAKGEDPLLAAYQARDLMDFSMQGQWRAVRFLTQVVPFLNARLQGLYKLGRDGVVPTGRVLFGGGDATDKQIAKRFGAVTGAVAMASIALMAAYADDEDWKKREDWDRDTYWWFKIGDTAFRIPKPFEVGAIGTIAERTAELFMTDDLTGERFLQRLGHMMSSTFALNPIPQMVKPLLDVYANEDSFTQRPIETMGMERLQPQDRFTGQTSEVAKWLGQLGLPEPGRLMSGQYQALSPVQIDALIRGYFSWLGVSATRIVDEGVRLVADRPVRPEMQLRDVFFAGNFVEGLPANSSRYVTALYDQSKAIESAYASYRFALRQGDQARAAELLAEDGDKIRLNPLVTRAKQTLAKLNENVRAIERSTTLSASEKRAQIDRIKALQNQIAMRISAQLQ